MARQAAGIQGRSLGRGVGWSQTRLVLCLGALLLLQDAGLAGQTGRTTSLKGKVVGVDGAPVAGAVVKLHEPGAEDVVGETDVAGVFRLRTGRHDRYEVTVDTGDHRHGALSVVEPPDSLQIVVRAVAGAPRAMEFADKPDFTVAGITDWTAVGGHGSDATLRTSEEMARQTAALMFSAAAEGAAVKGEVPLEEARLREAVTAEPESYAANRALGDFYLRTARYTDASNFLEKALTIHGGAASDEYAAALACRGEGEFARARQHAMRALGREDRAEYHALAAKLDEQLSDPLAAAREDERAAALDPSEANFFAWGSELLVHRAIWQAAEVFGKGARLHPASQRLKTGWGAALFGGAKYEEAAERLCEASDLDPSNRETYVFLGKLGVTSPVPLACVGEKLGRFVTMRPEDRDANYYEAMMLVKGGASSDRARAAELLRKAVAANAGFAEGYLQLGILALAQRDNVVAQVEFERALRADPSLAEAHYRLGVVYDRTGRPVEAKAEFARHEALVKVQAEAVERERQQVKQFLVVLKGTHADPVRK